MQKQDREEGLVREVVVFESGVKDYLQERLKGHMYNIMVVIESAIADDAQTRRIRKVVLDNMNDFFRAAIKFTGYGDGA